jgi:hypothetical protein
MEAAGAPRLDAERLFQGWSAAQRGALVSVGHRGGTRAGFVARLCRCGGRGTKRAPNSFGGPPRGHLRARDAGVLSSPSDPS